MHLHHTILSSQKVSAKLIFRVIEILHMKTVERYLWITTFPDAEFTASSCKQCRLQQQQCHIHKIQLLEVIAPTFNTKTPSKSTFLYLFLTCALIKPSKSLQLAMSCTLRCIYMD